MHSSRFIYVTDKFVPCQVFWFKNWHVGFFVRKEVVAPFLQHALACVSDRLIWKHELRVLYVQNGVCVELNSRRRNFLSCIECHQEREFHSSLCFHLRKNNGKHGHSFRMFCAHRMYLGPRQTAHVRIHKYC